ncbi:hypothetical protein OBBRIDRAFT_891198 [Obba rivulosa]|uniref:Uncharacterized protein n=1 Tax=Obba rivulosa TaxID=1052685 RepID=A0A8E2ANC7_9APHY|nr:hypothetical protein OBBRIDRAFT_891198 [Obba rivulosa]
MREWTYFYYGYCFCASRVRDVAVETLRLPEDTLAPDAACIILRHLRYWCNLNRHPWMFKTVVYDTDEEIRSKYANFASDVFDKEDHQAITVLVLYVPVVGESPPSQHPVIDHKLKDFCEPRLGPARWWKKSHTTDLQDMTGDIPLSDIVPERYYM